MWHCVKSCSQNFTLVKGFLNAILVWIKKPHVVDRNLCGSSNTIYHTKLTEIFTDDLNYLISYFSSILTSLSAKFKSIEDLKIELTEYLKLIETESFSLTNSFLILRCIIPKNEERSTFYEIVVLDVSNQIISFSQIGKSLNGQIIINQTVNQFYSFKLIDHQLVLNIYKTPCSDKGVSMEWLSKILFVKISKWMNENELNTNPTTLKLISFEAYNTKYNILKNKYGPYFVENWSEQTDPKKFVYEDIGIAAYLLLIWEKKEWEIESKRKYKFIDLGCGNGLLVYILSSEGHRGYGIDIRRRKIWDSLSEKADLREEVFIPSNTFAFADIEWIIGNHSDELTPWIPVLAYKSECQYFVIPCCLYDFFGKFNNKSASKTSGNYEMYLDFVYNVGEVCGFSMFKDILRIPSTKKVCFVGIKNANISIDETAIEDLLSRRYEGPLDWKCHDWASYFTPRPKVEKIRNAVGLENEVKERVWLKTYLFLLQEANYVVLPDGREWNCGGEIDMSEISLLHQLDLAHLKSEAGGLQTLLRNCPDIFMVKGGKVSIRNWVSAEYENYRKSRAKKHPANLNINLQKFKLCFHFKHHPDGCPTLQNCRFAHY